VTPTRDLADHLRALVTCQHLLCGAPVEDPPDLREAAEWEMVEAGEYAVLAFRGENYMVGLSPGHEGAGARAAVRVLRDRLTRTGRLQSAVHWRNWGSAKATKRLGATLMGMDDNGFFHYELTRENFRYG
jgi:hypothetical protein